MGKLIFISATQEERLKKAIKFTPITQEDLDENRCKAYLSIDEEYKHSDVMTHYYVNRLGNEIKCYIQKYDKRLDSYVVTNENGAGAHIHNDKLFKIN